MFSEDEEALFAAAIAVMGNAHVPYSGFPVGAAIRSGSGAIYAGCNVENASFPEGWCAETSAIAAMVSAGERTIAALAVVAARVGGVVPCGGCRQRILEFAAADIAIILGTRDGPSERLGMTDLLPRAFRDEALS